MAKRKSKPSSSSSSSSSTSSATSSATSSTLPSAPTSTGFDGTKNLKHNTGTKRRQRSTQNNSNSTNPLVFASDKAILHAQDNNIRVDNCENGQRMALLSGHPAQVVSICVSPWNSLQVISCDAANNVGVFDYQEGRCVSIISNTDVERIEKKYAVVLCNNKKGNDNQNDEPKTKKQWKVCEYRIQNNSFEIVKDIFNGGKRMCKNLIVNDNYVAAISGKFLFIYNINTDKVTKIRHEQNINCASVHPNRDIFVIGDSVGQVVTIRQNGSTFADHVLTKWHWHSSGVKSLQFNVDGTHFVSGGSEAVLVMWQAETGQKSFLPRLGAPITTVACSPGGSYNAALLESKMLQIVDARTRFAKVQIQGLAYSQIPNAKINKSTASKTSPFGMVIEPRFQSVVVQREPGKLQFFDMKQDCLLANVDVVSRNVVTGSEREARVIPTVVDLVTFSPNKARKMVTVERRRKHSCIKFWVLDRSVPQVGSNNSNGASGSTTTTSSTRFGRYVMTTHIENPHELPLVACLMHPNGEMVITASKDRTFKVWQLKQGTGQWNCRSVGFYRNEPILAASLSHDGSLLALAYGSIVTLWDPFHNSMIGVLAHPSCNDHVVQNIKFFNHKLLAVSTGSGTLFVWDITTSSVVWSVKFSSVTALGVHDEKNLLVAVDNSKLLVFHGSSPVPRSFYKAPNQFSTRSQQILGVAYSERVSSYIFTTNEGVANKFELVKEEEEEAAEEKTVDEEEVDASQTFVAQPHKGSHVTTFSVLRAKQQLENARKVDKEENLHKHDTTDIQARVAHTSSEAIKALDDFPSSVLPPLSRIFDSLMCTTDVEKSATEGTKRSDKKGQKRNHASAFDKGSVQTTASASSAATTTTTTTTTTSTTTTSSSSSSSAAAASASSLASSSTPSKKKSGSTAGNTTALASDSTSMDSDEEERKIDKKLDLAFQSEMFDFFKNTNLKTTSNAKVDTKTTKKKSPKSPSKKPIKSPSSAKKRKKIRSTSK